ncbi:surface carbohydrate biosynthesis protein [uncultured Erythrobacter sp.]|uniref:surface carbohydrate biosynthesis protein n=1 Tax=uncultured Erythrobacter sp. TaxID=263913 RepID=UPI00262F4D01|nr:surface carbohydrate biosynthesis protein [uncultured Erythrobacter sp.]
MFLGDIPPRRIGLVVDHPQRDLDGLCLVAQLLAERGHETVLLPFYTQHFDLPNVALDAIVLNYVRPANLALAKAAAARGIALVVLDTEGGLIPENGPTSAKGIARFLRSSGLDMQLALYLFWGEHLRETIAAETRLDPQRLIVTGCPRFDLSQPSYSRAQFRKDRVLVNTNFPVANPAHSGGSSTDAKAMGSVGFSEREIADLAMIVREAMDNMIEAVRALACARPKLHFAIRPHPFERAEPYKRAFADLANVSIEREGTAMEALAGSRCLLHINCTTAIEAVLTNVPPISLDFVNSDRLEAMARLPSQISHRAGHLEAALNLIDRAETLPPGQAHDCITPFFGALDGKAAIRAAEVLASAPLPSSAGSERQPLRRRITASLGAAIGSSAIEDLRRKFSPARSAKSFSAEEVRRRIERLARAHGQDPAKVDQLRSGLGLPIEALKLSPSPSREAHEFNAFGPNEDPQNARR